MGELTTDNDRKKAARKWSNICVRACDLRSPENNKECCGISASWL